MKKFKHLFALLLVLALALSLVACSSSSSRRQRSRRDDESRSDAMGEFWGIEWQGDELGAIAFLGCSNDIYADTIQYAFARYSDAFGFSDSTIAGVETEGNAVYLVIVRYGDAEIVVEEFDNGEAGEEIYASSDYWYVVLRCNLNDSNTLVTLRSSMGDISFSPALSSADGSVQLPGGGRLRDITMDSGDTAELMVGEWCMYDTDSGWEAWHIFSIRLDGTLTYTLYFYEEDWRLEELEGTYSFATEDSGYPVGTFFIDMTRAFFDRGLFEGPGLAPDGVLRGAYRVDFSGDDTMTLTCLEGDSLAFYVNVSRPCVFERITG